MHTTPEDQIVIVTSLLEQTLESSEETDGDDPVVVGEIMFDLLQEWDDAER